MPFAAPKQYKYATTLIHCIQQIKKHRKHFSDQRQGKYCVYTRKDHIKAGT